jgi:hypothetical protein
MEITTAIDSVNNSDSSGHEHAGYFPSQGFPTGEQPQLQDQYGTCSESWPAGPLDHSIRTLVKRENSATSARVIIAGAAR